MNQNIGWRFFNLLISFNKYCKSIQTRDLRLYRLLVIHSLQKKTTFHFPFRQLRISSWNCLGKDKSRFTSNKFFKCKISSLLFQIWIILKLMSLSIGICTKRSLICRTFSVKIQWNLARRVLSLRLKICLNPCSMEIVVIFWLNFYKKARFIFRFIRMKLKKNIFRCSNNF